jgi:hypothetical protein
MRVHSNAMNTSESRSAMPSGAALPSPTPPPRLACVGDAVLEGRSNEDDELPATHCGLSASGAAARTTRGHAASGSAMANARAIDRETRWLNRCRRVMATAHCNERAKPRARKRPPSRSRLTVGACKFWPHWRCKNPPRPVKSEKNVLVPVAVWTPRTVTWTVVRRPRFAPCGKLLEQPIAASRLGLVIGHVCT